MNTQNQNIPIRGIAASFTTPVLLGMAPIFGKLAIQAGSDAFTVAALRTIVAVVLLWLVYILFFRRFIFIYPAGLLGCIMIGTINGIGSLFYYGGLSQLDASLVQLINGSYLAFAVLLARVVGQPTERRTLIRVMLALLALVIITGTGSGEINWAGVGLMLGSALMFAGTVTLSQYVLFEMPSPTATLYILTTMAVVVTMVWLPISAPLNTAPTLDAWTAIILLGLTTAGSRLAMFAGVKFLGGMQTAILAITEIGVALLLASLVLGESLNVAQWAGVALLALSILLIRQRDLLPRGINPNALIVANMASVQFQRIAFHRAFGTQEHDNEHGTMGELTTQEMLAIQRMMGASSGPLDPYPIGQLGRMMNTVQAEVIDTQPIELDAETRERLRRPPDESE